MTTDYNTEYNVAEQATDPLRIFDVIDAERSVAIHRAFAAGKVITEQRLNPHTSLVEACPLYTQLFKHQRFYEQHFHHQGRQLQFVDRGSFFYIGESDNEEGDDNAVKLQGILLILARYWVGTGRNIDLLSNESFGFNEADLSAIRQNDQYLTILRALDRKFTLDRALEYLCQRNFCFRLGAESYVLSSAGRFFLSTLVEDYLAQIDEAPVVE